MYVRHLDGVDAGPPGRRQVGPDVVQKDDLLASQLQPLQQQADIQVKGPIFLHDHSAPKLYLEALVKHAVGHLKRKSISCDN